MTDHLEKVLTILYITKDWIKVGVAYELLPLQLAIANGSICYLLSNLTQSMNCYMVTHVAQNFLHDPRSYFKKR